MSLEAATQVLKTLRANSYEAFFAGGSVRDRVMGKDPHDYDIVTSANPEQVKKVFSKVLDVGVKFGISVVILDETPIEVATFRKDGKYEDARHPSRVETCNNLEEDSERRDFTINAMYFDPEEDLILDFHSGKDDIANKLIRAVGEPSKRLSEDALRILRAVRFKAQLNFEIEENTQNAIKSNLHLINNLSDERIRDELIKICATKNPDVGFETMHELGILPYVLPTAGRMKGCKQDVIHHPEGDVWTHAMQVVRQLVKMNADPILILAGFLHDIGKPDCMQIRVEESLQRISNIGHEDKGAEIAGKLCKRLKFPGDATDKIVTLIKNHMKAHEGEKMKPSTLTKFFRELDSKGILQCQIMLQHADGGGNGRSLYEFYKTKMLLVNEGKIKIVPTKLINGDDLKSLFKLKPGPIYKEVLGAVLEAQDEGIVCTREDAIAFVDNLLKRDS